MTPHRFPRRHRTKISESRADADFGKRSRPAADPGLLSVHWESGPISSHQKDTNLGLTQARLDPVDGTTNSLIHGLMPSEVKFIQVQRRRWLKHDRDITTRPECFNYRNPFGPQPPYPKENRGPGNLGEDLPDAPGDQQCT